MDIQGFGWRHEYDNAPFDLWSQKNATFREPTKGELEWIYARFRAARVRSDLPHIVIRTYSPPQSEIPLTIGSALVRFVRPDQKAAPCVPWGCLKALGDARRPDLLSTPVPPFAFPSTQQCEDVIHRLAKEVDMQAIHFCPPYIFVELDMESSRKYVCETLPARAGGIEIMYHESWHDFWDDHTQMGHDSSETPGKSAINDDGKSTLPENTKNSLVAKPAKQLIPFEDIKAGSWFEMDSPTLGDFNLCARARSYHKAPGSNHGIISAEGWEVSIMYALVEDVVPSVKDRLNGVMVTDEMGRIAGFLCDGDSSSGMWAKAAVLDPLISLDWTLV